MEKQRGSNKHGALLIRVIAIAIGSSKHNREFQALWHDCEYSLEAVSSRQKKHHDGRELPTVAHGTKACTMILSSILFSLLPSIFLIEKSSKRSFAVLMQLYSSPTHCHAMLSSTLVVAAAVLHQ